MRRRTPTLRNGRSSRALAEEFLPVKAQATESARCSRWATKSSRSTASRAPNQAFRRGRTDFRARGMASGRLERGAAHAVVPLDRTHLEAVDAVFNTLPAREGLNFGEATSSSTKPFAKGRRASSSFGRSKPRRSSNRRKPSSPGTRVRHRRVPSICCAGASLARSRPGSTRTRSFCQKAARSGQATF